MKRSVRRMKLSRRVLFERLEERYLLASFHGLGDLLGGPNSSSAFGVSADGTYVVGASYSDKGREPFRWTASTGMVGLGGFPGDTTVNGAARAVSADGEVVVGAIGTQAFRWTATSGSIGLGYLPCPGCAHAFSSAADVSANGTVVVGSSSITPANTGAFRWTQTGRLSVKPRYQ